MVRLDGLLDFVPDLTGAMEPPRWLFGDADRFSEPAIITSIQPGMDNHTTTCTVTAVNYSEEIFTDDENEPPEEDVTWWE